jgi:flagellar P-ring protein precursor FlgI
MPPLPLARRARAVLLASALAAAPGAAQTGAAQTGAPEAGAPDVQAATVRVDRISGMLVVSGPDPAAPARAAPGVATARTVRIVEEYVVSQPPPFSQGGRTVVVPRTRIVIEDGGDARAMAPLSPGDTPAALAAKLNAMGLTKAEMIDVLARLQRAGVVRGRFRVE